MKYTVLIFLYIFLFIGCRNKQEPLLPNIFPELLILDIRFQGIPKENVRIDQPSRKIFVKMPALLTTDKLTPTLILSEEARLLDQNDLERVIAQAGNWCYPEAEDMLSLRLIKKDSPNQVQDVRYTIHPEASAPLRITQSTPIANFEIGESFNIHLEAQNVYGNTMPTAVIFTNTKTAKQILIKSPHLVNGLYYLNKASIYAYSVPFEPGSYTIKMQLANGQLLDVAPTLTTVPGKSRIEHQSAVLGRLNGLPGETLVLNGRNLFQNLVAFRLLLPDGNTLPLKSESTSDGTQVRILIPQTLSAGYYGVEILREGQPLGISYRLSVLRQERQLFIGKLNKLPTVGQYPTNTSLVLARNTSIPVSFGPVENLDRYFLALIDETNVAVFYRFALTWPIEADPYFILPASVPSGRYKAVMQEIDLVTKEAIQQSEPFERIVVLQ